MSMMGSSHRDIDRYCTCIKKNWEWPWVRVFISVHVRTVLCLLPVCQSMMEYQWKTKSDAEIAIFSILDQASMSQHLDKLTNYVY